MMASLHHAALRAGPVVGIQLTMAITREISTDGQRVARALSDAELAERLGFDIVWLSEHHQARFGCVDPLLLIGHLAVRTRHIRLGTAAVTLPLHHPVEVAERAVLVDVLSGGRLELGVGRGFLETEFAMFGLELESARSRFVASLAEMKWHWRNLAVASDHHAVAPQSLQHPHPPLWCAVSTSPDTIRAAIEQDCGILLASTGRQLAANLTVIRRTQARVHRTVPLSISRVVSVEATTDAAVAAATTEIDWYLRHVAEPAGGSIEGHTERLLKEFVITGTPRECLAKLRQLLVKTRASHLMCVFTLGGRPQPLVHDSMARFAHDVLPALRAHDQASATPS